MKALTEYITDFANWEYFLLAAIAVIMFIVYLMRWRFFRLQSVPLLFDGKDGEEEDNEKGENKVSCFPSSPVKVSVIIATHNNGAHLEYLLTQLLRQKSEARFEVIVADQRSEDDTPETLRRLEQTFSHLRHTFVPESSRFIEGRKLALTLAIRAARGEWCVVVDAETERVPERWLDGWYKTLRRGSNFAIAYSSYEADGMVRMTRAITERALLFSYSLFHYKHGKIAVCPTSNWAVRKEWFLKEGGFADSVTLPFGEESLFAAAHADVATTLFFATPETTLRRSAPDHTSLAAARVCHKEIRRHQPLFVRLFSMRQAVASWLGYVLGFLFFAYIWLRKDFWTIEWESYLHNGALADGIFLVLLIVALVLPPMLVRHTFRVLEENRNPLYIYVYEMFHPWYVLTTWGKHFMVKNSFTRKYI